MGKQAWERDERTNGWVKEAGGKWASQRKGRWARKRHGRRSGQEWERGGWGGGELVSGG